MSFCLSLHFNTSRASLLFLVLLPLQPPFLILFLISVQVLKLFLSLLLSSVVGDRLSAPTEEGQNNLLSAINQIKGCAAQTRSWILDGVLTLSGQKNHGNPPMGGGRSAGAEQFTGLGPRCSVSQPDVFCVDCSVRSWPGLDLCDLRPAGVRGQGQHT